MSVLRSARPTPLYPPIAPHRTGMLDVGDGQHVYWEESGRPDGAPALFVHGGPGGGTHDDNRRFFDPSHYRIILFDQRGCGRSTPHIADGADLAVNTTDHLLDDIDRLRGHLGVERWLVFGGSWGSTLALAHAQRRPEHVTALVLRGIFLVRRAELEWYYNAGGTGSGGAAALFPDVWAEFTAPIADRPEGTHPIEAYHALLHGEDRDVATRAAIAWSRWEAATSTLRPNPAHVEDNSDPRFATAFARIENHYFRHGGFLDDGQLLSEAGRIADVPGVIVQGRYDVVCPPTSAWDLHRAWPASRLVFVDDAGHAAAETGTAAQLVAATDGFR